MTTLKVTIRDSFLEDFLSIVEHYKDQIQIEKDENLIEDPYFYNRQKELQQNLIEFDNGTIEIVSQEEYDKEKENLFVELKSKYAN